MKYVSLMVAVCAMLMWSCSQKVTTTPQPQPPKSPTPVKPTPTANVNKGLIAHYPLDGDANDVVNELNGKLYGPTLTSDRKNNPDSAYEFDGVDDYIDLGDKPEFQFTGNYSLSIWIYFPGEQQAGNILIKWAKEHPFNQYNFGIYKGISKPQKSNYITFFNRHDKNMNDKKIFASNMPLDKGWHHIVVTNDMDGVASIYIDNQLAGNSAKATGTVEVKGYPLIIGGNKDANSFFYRGKIDEIRFYNKILNKQEIEQLYTN